MTRLRGEGGETLVELLLTVSIMGIAFVAILTGVAVTIAASDTQRQESTAEGVVRSYAEVIVDPKNTPYVPCTAGADTSTYALPRGFALPSERWSASVSAVRFLQPPPSGSPLSTVASSYDAGCPGADLGAQQLVLRVRSATGKNQATATVTVVKARS